MKIMLLNPPNNHKISKDSRWPEYTKSGTLYYPFWLAYAAAVLMEDGRHKPMLVDAIAKEKTFPETLELLQKFAPDMLVIDTSTPTIYKDVDFVNEAKKILPEMKVVLTGRHPTAMPDKTFSISSSIDFIARQEYDYTILDLANALESGADLKSILGISFRDAGGKIIHNEPRPLVDDLDKVPFVSKAYKEFLNVWDYRYALARYPMIQIWTSRGCPARCVYCVDGNSLIILREGDEIKTIPIKDFVDDIMEKNSSVFGEYEFADVSNLGIKIWSSNKFVKLKKVSRTKKDKILKVKCEKGFYIKVSEEHTIPVRRDEKILDIKAKDLKVGDEIIRIRPASFGNSVFELNLFEEFLRNSPKKFLGDVYIHNLTSYFKYLDNKRVFGIVKKEFKSYWLQNKVLPIEKFAELREKYGAPKEVLEKLEIGGKNLVSIPLILKLTKEFMHLVGLFVAEGNYGNYNIVITKSDKETLEKITGIIRKIFPKTYLSKTEPTKERGGQISFGGKLIYLLFRYVMKIPEGAFNKRLPDFIFNTSEELAGACLAGAFTGDGLIDSRKISYTTTSEILVNQVQTLLLSMGMNPSFKIAKKSKPSNFLGREIKSKLEIYHCYIGSWDDRQRFVEKIGFLDNRQEKLLKFQEKRKPLRIKFLEHLQEKKPKTVSELSHELRISQPMVRYMALRLNHEGFVLRENENAGNTRKLKLSLKKSSKLRDGITEFTKIKSIEKVDGKSFLYDMETENNYFSANNLLVHNCDYPQVFTMHGYRTRSPKNVVDEMEWIHKNLPDVKEIFFEDDTFTIDIERTHAICDEIIRRGLNTLIWSCNVRACVPDETLKKMKEAGCRILIVGYESGNQKILNQMKKGIILKQAEQFTASAKKYGLKIFGCFMIGLPGDTRETIEDTFNFARRMNPDMVFFQQAVPFPGTEFYNWLKFNGYLRTEDHSKWLDENGRLDVLYDYPGLSGDELASIRDKLMVRYYMNPKHIFYTFMKNVHPHEFIRVVRYARDYLIYLAQRKYLEVKEGKKTFTKEEQKIPVAVPVQPAHS